MRLILASASPRRRRLIGLLTDDFVAVTCDADELTEGEPRRIAEENSRRKALAASRLYRGTVLGADTVVDFAGKALGKPKDAAEAKRMLRALSGRTHAVITGVTLTDGAKTVTASERTAVRFAELPDAVIDAYVNGGKAFGKAGAYGIQDEELAGYITYEGDYYNVVGLPVALTSLLMKEF